MVNDKYRWCHSDRERSTYPSVCQLGANSPIPSETVPLKAGRCFLLTIRAQDGRRYVSMWCDTEVNMAVK